MKIIGGSNNAALANTLSTICEIESGRELGAYKLKFRFDGVITTIRVAFDDQQSGAQMVITNMTTLPDTSGGISLDDPKGRGFGSVALQTLLTWAHNNGLTKIQAVQVQAQSERFWKKNSFVPLNNITNDFRHISTTLDPRPA